MIAILVAGVLLSAGCASGVPEVPAGKWDWNDFHPTYSNNNFGGRDAGVMRDERSGGYVQPIYPE
ncbi:MAG TPA: hypothetical protein VMV72_05510 [Verrucomicrobiae bacterium]|nr:hypothetical protein [Verrucomicrobiae bacterium]